MLSTAMSAKKAFSTDTSKSRMAENECLNQGNFLRQSTTKNTRRCPLSDKAARVLEVAILTAVIVCVMAILSLPSVLYFLTQVRTSFARTIGIHARLPNVCLCGSVSRMQ